eukprot:CAMPEP_0178823740 /NCGR_PEP_ID=MMETSP0746-20121128/5301_1 /TAXON_ID=913974 /ORGANISM="Nitzschia punctata, Strain CCMP561" /LENGTH=459 /DNA_ID=CAMNT_0020485361 /DNA_START=1 /DNA_END=1381 /DNA_ORIENTATION=-
MGKNQSFSLCFSRQPLASREGTEAGALTLGGVDVRLHASPMVFISAQSTLTNPNEGVKVLDVPAKSLNSGGVIVDSGTTDTYWNRAIRSEFENVFRQLTGGREHSNKPVQLTDDELYALPTILFQLESDADDTNPDINDVFHTPGMAGALDPHNPSDVILAFPPTHYMEYDDSTGLYTSRFYPTEGSGSVLGANAMMGHDIMFDIDNDDRIGWAESACDYTALVRDNGYEFDISGDIKDVVTVGEPASAPASDCSSYSSGAKCQSAEGCSWYWGKCKKSEDAQPDATPPPTAVATQGSVTEEPAPSSPPAGSPGTVTSAPSKSEEGIEGVEDFLEACSTPACRYPVVFGLVIALVTGCCLSYCWFRCRSGGGAQTNERYKYARAPADAVEIELTNGKHENGSHHSKQESFRDEPEDPPSNGLSGSTHSNSAESFSRSYRDEPHMASQSNNKPEFEGDFA